jgi:hypothetical protein
MKSTVSLLKRLYENTPPLFPEEIRKELSDALVKIENAETNLPEIENIMIKFGYEVWPWNEAYKEMYLIAEERMAEHFFVPKLASQTMFQYEKFKNYGGDYKAVHTGKAAQFFSIDERVEISKALVETRKEMKRFVDNEVRGTGRKKYLKGVEEFVKILNEIRSIIGNLKALADKEEEHQILAKEIRSKIRHFEYGLCYLGPKTDIRDVSKSIDFFEGRKEDLSRLSAVLVIK